MENGKVQKDDEVLRMQYFIHTLQVFEAEFLSRAKFWDQIPQLVEEIVNSGPLALGTYEAVADILVRSSITSHPFKPDCVILSARSPYPMDERQWLLATSYNTGTECLHGAMLDEAKRWFEASTVICRFVPGGQDRAEKISDTYTHLLSRYGPK
ncbi:hypothetical protein C0991_011442 [Blastosporella zonata]|nr:hypothetical protein C0991_011442 [Blastosporella zonata]